MRLNNGFFAALICGAIWGFIWMVVISVLFMLISGEITRPPVGSATVAGMLAAGFYLWFCSDDRNWFRDAVPGILVFVVLTALSGGKPLGLDFSVATSWQILALALFIGVTALSIHLCLSGMGNRHLNRYQLEHLLIRMLKGVGFTIFTVVVALPFYVMIMTSLKKSAITARQSPGFFPGFQPGSWSFVPLLYRALY